MIFVDTSFLFPLFHTGDIDHERVRERYADKEYSFVDCLSFVIMEKLGIREALAVDEDFTHRFVAIPGPL